MIFFNDKKKMPEKSKEVAKNLNELAKAGLVICTSNDSIEV